MAGIRKQRWERVCRAFNRFPAWLQWATWPWLLPVYFFAFFPILMPALGVAAAIFLFYLKWAYLGDEITWRGIGLFGMFLFWGPAILGYGLMAWVGIGTLPLAIVIFSRQWWEGRPFSLRGPEPDIPPDSRAEVLIRFREGKGLTPEHVRVILAIRDGQNRCFRPILMIAGGTFLLGILAIGVAWLLTGRFSKDAYLLVFFLSITMLSPILLIHDPFEQALRLQCRHCGRSLRLMDGLKTILESNSCLYCSGQEPLAAKAPDDKARGPLWDSEVL